MSGYVPLSPDEQEVLNKLIDQNDDLYVEIEGWGYHPSPDITHGDRRIQIEFPVKFTKPDYIHKVTYFDLKLKTRDGEVLFEDRLDARPPGRDALDVRAGLTVKLVWDLWINKISDDLINRISPERSGEVVKTVEHTAGE